MAKEIVLAGAVRTAIGKFQGTRAAVHPADLDAGIKRNQTASFKIY